MDNTQNRVTNERAVLAVDCGKAELGQAFGHVIIPALAGKRVAIKSTFEEQHRSFEASPRLRPESSPASEACK